MEENTKEISQSIKNMTLLLILVAFVFLIAVFADELNFRLKPANPQAWLGMETIELTPDIRKQYDLQSTNGLLVSRTFMGSPAQIAGIMEGDVIQRWNGISITSPEQLQRLIQTTQVADKITFTVERQGQEILVFGHVGIRPGGY